MKASNALIEKLLINLIIIYRISIKYNLLKSVTNHLIRLT